MSLEYLNKQYGLAELYLNKLYSTYRFRDTSSKFDLHSSERRMLPNTTRTKSKLTKKEGTELMRKV